VVHGATLVVLVVNACMVLRRLLRWSGHNDDVGYAVAYDLMQRIDIDQGHHTPDLGDQE
jgi:hypothetical protein